MSDPVAVTGSKAPFPMMIDEGVDEKGGEMVERLPTSDVMCELASDSMYHLDIETGGVSVSGLVSPGSMIRCECGSRTPPDTPAWTPPDTSERAPDMPAEHLPRSTHRNEGVEHHGEDLQNHHSVVQHGTLVAVSGTRMGRTTTSARLPPKDGRTTGVYPVHHRAH